MSLAFAFERLPAEDWPQWRGPRRDGHAPSTARVLAVLPADPRVVWRMKIGEGFASPVVAGGKVFYFDNQAGKETLHAIAESDHHELWHAAVDDTFQDEQGRDAFRRPPAAVRDDHGFQTVWALF